MREAAEAVVVQMVPESSGRDDLDGQTPPFLRILDNVLVQLLVGVRPGDLESLDLTGQRIDPDFEDDCREAIAMGEEWSVICAWRALKLGLAGRPVRHCLACGKLHVVGKGILLDQALSRVLPLQWCWQVQYMRRSNQRG